MPMSSFQTDVVTWAMHCFGSDSVCDPTVRAHRFLEEALELVQATGIPKSDALRLVDYVYSRPVGELEQEVGGVMVTLATYCDALGLSMDSCAVQELNRAIINTAAIRRKAELKPKFTDAPSVSANAIRLYAWEGFADWIRVGDMDRIREVYQTLRALGLTAAEIARKAEAPVEIMETLA